MSDPLVLKTCRLCGVRLTNAEGRFGATRSLFGGKKKDQQTTVWEICRHRSVLGWPSWSFSTHNNVNRASTHLTRWSQLRKRYKNGSHSSNIKLTRMEKLERRGRWIPLLKHPGPQKSVALLSVQIKRHPQPSQQYPAVIPPRYVTLPCCFIYLTATWINCKYE